MPPGYRDLVQHQTQDKLDRRDLELLKCGRHFRLSPTMKVLVGRDQRDNEAMESLIRPGDVVFRAELYPGPLVVIPQAPDDADLTTAASLCASYSDAPQGEMVAVLVEGRPDEKILFSSRSSREMFQDLLL